MYQKDVIGMFFISHYALCICPVFVVVNKVVLSLV